MDHVTLLKRYRNEFRLFLGRCMNDLNVTCTRLYWGGKKKDNYSPLLGHKLIEFSTTKPEMSRRDTSVWSRKGHLQSTDNVYPANLDFK